MADFNVSIIEPNETNRPAIALDSLDRLISYPGGIEAMLNRCRSVPIQQGNEHGPYHMEAVGSCLHGIADGSIFEVDPSCKVESLGLCLLSVKGSEIPSCKIFLSMVRSITFDGRNYNDLVMVAQTNPMHVFAIEASNLKFLHPVSCQNTDFLELTSQFPRLIDAGIVGRSTNSINPEWRPWHESKPTEIAAMGGLVGVAGAKLFSAQEIKQVSQALESDLADAVDDPADIAQKIIGKLQSVGAASVDEVNLDDLDVSGPGVAKAIANATAAIKLNPGVATMLSPSVRTRQVYNQLVEGTVYTNLQSEGRTLGPAVESLVKQVDRGGLGKFIEESQQAYKEMRKAGINIPKREFMERASFATRRNDKGDNPYISKAAKSARKNILDPLFQRAVEVGLLPEGLKVKTAPSYLHRVWNVRRLEIEEPKFRSITKDWLRGLLNEVAATSRNAPPDFVSDLDKEDYLDEIVTGIFDNLTGRAGEDVPDWLIPATRGPLKGRTFQIPDRLIEEFLENDLEVVLRRYSRIMSAEVELTGKFGRADMRDQVAEIREDYENLRASVNANPDLSQAQKQKEISRLVSREASDIQNLEAFRDMIRGTYRAAENASGWGRATRLALLWNYMRLLGGVVLTSLTDTVRVPAVHGLRATMREGIPELAKSIRGASPSIAEAKELGAVTETLLQSRLATLAELHDPYAIGSPFERTMSNASNAFTKLTALGYWNDFWKGVGSVLTQNRIVRNSLAGDYSKLDKYERQYMGWLGIDESMAGRIARMFEEFGRREGASYIANTSRWTDKEAVRVYAAALNKDTDRTIVTAGVSDKPLFLQSNTGRLVGQFKTFLLASHQKVLIAGLQERPHRFAEMLVGGTSIGMLIAYLKYVERGDFDKAEKLLENPGLWIADGLDRSGVLALPFEISNTAEKLGVPIGIKSGVQALLDDPDRDQGVSRYASRNKLGTALGPSAGIFQDITTFAEQAMKGDLKRSGANAAIRQIPGATLPGVRTGIHVGAKPALQEFVGQ